ncbi:MAG: flagellar hook-basal body complex protein, partial [Planctomycetota bacterium]
MNYGTYLSASGMRQALASQGVIANNLANVETNGFKRVLTLHGERGLSDNHKVPDELAGMTGGKLLLPTHLDGSQGGPEQTGRPLDVAVVGDGWLQVRTSTPAGDQDLLTRDGRLMLTKDGNLALVTDPT